MVGMGRPAGRRHGRLARGANGKNCQLSLVSMDRIVGLSAPMAVVAAAHTRNVCSVRTAHVSPPLSLRTPQAANKERDPNHPLYPSFTGVRPGRAPRDVAAYTLAGGRTPLLAAGEAAWLWGGWEYGSCWGAGSEESESRVWRVSVAI